MSRWIGGTRRCGQVAAGLLMVCLVACAGESDEAPGEAGEAPPLQGEAGAPEAGPGDTGAAERPQAGGGAVDLDAAGGEPSPADAGRGAPGVLIAEGARWRHAAAEAVEGEWSSPVFDDGGWDEAEAPLFALPDEALLARIAFTADNLAALYAGGPAGEGMRRLSEVPAEWPEVARLEVALRPGEHLYAAAWEPAGDNGGPQMFVAEAAAGEAPPLRTTVQTWGARLGPPNALSAEGPDPAEVAALVAEDRWEVPAAAAPVPAAPWGDVLAEALPARPHYLWFDTFEPDSATNAAETYALFGAREPLVPRPGRAVIPYAVETYLRADFVVEGEPGDLALRLDLRVDDGAVVFLNGWEVARLNAPLNGWPASEAGGPRWQRGLRLPTRALNPGRNVLAVALRQSDDRQGDLYFDARLALVPADAPPPDGAVPDAAPLDAAPDVPAPPPPCGCIAGDARVCGPRLMALAARTGCIAPPEAEQPDALLTCADETWRVVEQCGHGCAFTAEAEVFDDHCELPVCDCFVRVAWCGRGAAREAEGMGCRIPLLPEHDGDILHCPEGRWAVRERCALGCIEAPRGTPDSCRDESVYRAPFDCGATYTCSNANHTRTHTGTDAFAYDFAMPRGRNVRAMRGGRVHRVRNVSGPGSHCYDSGDRSCANSANTVEIMHSDGTMGLYMHLQRGTVAPGAAVSQGEVIGLSGNSGWSYGAHTHVQVQQNCGSWWCASMPFQFIEDGALNSNEPLRSQNCP